MGSFTSAACGGAVYNLFIQQVKAVAAQKTLWVKAHRQLTSLLTTPGYPKNLPHLSPKLYAAKNNQITTVKKMFYPVSTPPTIIKTKEIEEERY